MKNTCQMWTSGFNWEEHLCSYKKAGTAKHYWKRIMQLLCVWTVVT